jgi:hypothetical protein
MARPTVVETEQELLAAIGTPPPGTRAVALVGGADKVAPAALPALAAFFRTLASVLDSDRWVLVDGGTDSGVMRLVAEARAATNSTFRLVGVAPRGRVGRATRGGDVVTLAGGHPELLLVPGTSFGDETPWLFRAADHLAGGRAVTLVVNGGRLTLGEAIRRLDASLPVVGVAGSGRAADVLARAASAGGRLGASPDNDADEEFRPFDVDEITTDRLCIVSIDIGADDLAGALAASHAEGIAR